MLAKGERYTREQLTALLLRKDLLIVYNNLGTLKYIPGGRKFAVVTSSKHEKRAVYRNKVRRRAYDVFRRSGVSLSGVLYASKHSYGFTFKQTAALAEELFAKSAR